MIGSEVRRIRDALGITQSQLAGLLGVNPVTVSRWERGGTSADPWRSALLEAFGMAAERAGTRAGREAVTMLSCGGVAVALFHLLFLSGVRARALAARFEVSDDV